jgi:hypothetical protein
MPANCSADIQAVIAYVDSIGINGTAAQQAALQAQFGMENVSHYDDFASARESTCV